MSYLSYLMSLVYAKIRLVGAYCEGIKWFGMQGLEIVMVIYVDILRCCKTIQLQLYEYELGRD